LPILRQKSDTYDSTIKLKNNKIDSIISMYVSIKYSITKGKVSSPKLNETKTFETNLNDLAKHKDDISKLNAKFLDSGDITKAYIVK
jgi:hypothetical protein